MEDSKVEVVLREIEFLAQEYNLPIIGKNKAVILSNLIKAHSPSFALEVGTLIGYSAIAIANALPENGKLITIEVNRKNANIAKKYFERSCLKNKIQLVVGDARVVIPKLNYSFNFMFIDADKRQYLEYLKLAEPLLKEGSIIVADNVKIFRNILSDYLDYVRGSKKILEL